MRRAAVVSYLLLGAAAAVVAARAEVPEGATATDVEVANRTRVQGRIGTGDEIETLRLRAPAGGTLDVQVRSTSGGSVQVRILAPDGAEIERVPAVALKGGVRIRGVPLDADGLHGVEVRSGDGEATGYDARLSWAASRTVRLRATVPPEGLDVPIAAEGGASLAIRLGAGTAVASITGPDGRDLGAGPGRKVAVVAATTGTHVIRVVPADGPATTTAKVTVKAGRTKGKRTLDLAALERAAGEGRLVRRLLDGSGGSVVAEPLAGGATVGVDVSGARLDVPAGAVTSPVGVDVRPDGDIAPPRPGLGAAGVAVAFDDGDTPLTGDLSVTIPFDGAAFAAGTDDLVVVHRDDDGNVTEMTGSFDVDADAGVVTVPTSHLSSYQVFRRAVEIVDVDDVPQPTDLALAPDGTLYVVSGDGRVRRLPPGADAFEEFAGGGARTDDGAPRADFAFGVLFNVAVTADGDVLVAGGAAGGSQGDVVHRIAPDGSVTRIAGDGRSRFAEGADARDAGVPFLDGLTVTAGGDLLLGTVEGLSSRVLRLSGEDGTLRTIAGRGDFFDEHVDPLDALLPGARAILVDDHGRLLVAATSLLARFDLEGRDVEAVAGPVDQVPEGDASEDRAAGQGAPLRSVAFGGLTDLAFADGDTQVVFAADPIARVVWRLDLRRSRAFVAAGRNLTAALGGATPPPPVGGRELAIPIAIQPVGERLYIADLALGKVLVLRPVE